MRKFRIVFISLGVILILAAGGLFLLGYFSPKKAGLLIESNPQSMVYINDVQVSRTPYDTTLSPGEITLKLIPESTSTPLVPYETKVALVSGVKTIVRREFGESEDGSSGEVISFEKVGGTEATLAIVSVPDSSQVAIDGQTRGFTPYRMSSLSSGEHSVEVSSKGYKTRTLTLNMVPGYKTTLISKLAVDGTVKSDSGQTQPEMQSNKAMIEILNTPTGFLRVRSEPSTLASEVAQVKPGEQYDFIDEDADTGWFKISYDVNKEGWVSNQYAKKIEASSAEATPSPSPTPQS